MAIHATNLLYDAAHPATPGSPRVDYALTPCFLALTLIPLRFFIFAIMASPWRSSLLFFCPPFPPPPVISPGARKRALYSAPDGGRDGIADSSSINQ